MHCPFCGHLEDKVVDSRESREGDTIRRRRECLDCGKRFTSYERVEEVPILVVKKDGSREPFDRQKVLRGMMAACQKRPVSMAQLEEATGEIQAKLLEQPDREILSRSLGDLVMDALKLLDSVAYVRFASIYRDFKDLPDFVKALEVLMKGQNPINTKTTMPPPPVPLTKTPFTQNPPTPPPLSPTPLFPGVAPARLGPAKRRKGR